MILSKGKFRVIIIAFALLLIGLMAASTPQYASAATQHYYGLTTDGPLNVRTGPGTSYQSIGKLVEGTAISINTIKTVGDTKWYGLTYQSRQGYVCGNYVKLTGTQYFYTKPIRSIVIAGPLNVRSGPDTTRTVIGSLSKGSAISIESIYTVYDGDKWYRITFDRHKGFVNAKYVATNINGGDLTVYSQSKSATATSAINVHTGPKSTFAVIGQKTKGSTLSLRGCYVDETGFKWYLITYQHRVCYISSKYVSFTSIAGSSNAQRIIDLALSKVGSAYVYGAEGPNSFDCSGFVYWVVNNSGIDGLTVPRTSDALYAEYQSNNIGTNVANARPGDIILFSDNGEASGICHSAIYYKDGKMIHASTSTTGVIISEVSYSTTNKSVFAIIRLPGV